MKSAAIASWELTIEDCEFYYLKLSGVELKDNPFHWPEYNRVVREA